MHLCSYHLLWMHLLVKLKNKDASSLFLCFLVKLISFLLHTAYEISSQLYFAQQGFPLFL